MQSSPPTSATPDRRKNSVSASSRRPKRTPGGTAPAGVRAKEKLVRRRGDLQEVGERSGGAVATGEALGLEVPILHSIHDRREAGIETRGQRVAPGAPQIRDETELDVVDIAHQIAGGMRVLDQIGPDVALAVGDDVAAGDLDDVRIDLLFRRVRPERVGRGEDFLEEVRVALS